VNPAESWRLGVEILSDLKRRIIVVLHPLPAHHDETAFAMAYAAMSPQSQVVRASSDPEAVELAKRAVAEGIPVVFVDYGKDFLHRLPPGAYVVDHHLKPRDVDKPRATADLAVLIAEKNGVKISDFAKRYLNMVSLIDTHDTALLSLERFEVGKSLVMAPRVKGGLLAEAGRILLSMDEGSYARQAADAYKKLVEAFRVFVDERDPVKKAKKIDALIAGSRRGFYNPESYAASARPAALVSPLDAAAVAAVVRLRATDVLQEAVRARLEAFRAAEVGEIRAAVAYLRVPELGWERPVVYVDRPLELSAHAASQLLSRYRGAVGVVVPNTRDSNSFIIFMKQAMPRVDGITLIKSGGFAVYRAESGSVAVQPLGMRI
jgi:hypothetical protein